MWQPQGLFSQFCLRTPVVLSGVESIRGLYNYPGERFAVVHGSTMTDEIKMTISQVFKKKDVRFIRRSWAGEPTIEGLSESLKEIEEYRPDVLIAFGGGSVIDGVKLCRLYYEFPFYEASQSRIDGSALTTRFIAVPTTIGSGAEVSSAAVYWNKNRHRKEMAVIHELQPDVIVYDEKYVSQTPKRILYASALDGISHIVEGYVSNVSNDMVELLAEKGLAVFREILETDDDIDFSKLQYAGYIGGIVQNHCLVGGAHAIAHQLTDYEFSHGEAVGLLLSAVIRVNSTNSDSAAKYDYLVQKAGYADTAELLSFLDRMINTSKIAVRKEEIKEILTENFDSMKGNIADDRGGKGNPIPIDDEYVRNVIRSL